jgi:trimeric autotransporter adhesin
MRAIPNNSSVMFRLPQLFIESMLSLVFLLLLVFASTVVFAAPPAAGTSIGNQASATYTDGSGITRTVTSNTVQTVVQQVASLTLTANGAKTASIGSTVYYPHTLTNTGNGSDTFSLAAINAAGSAFNMTGITIYADNGSGLPTGPALTTSGVLAAGSTFKFVVAATVPPTATSGQTNSLTVTATSVFNATQTASNTDVTTVTANAVINVTKSVSASSGAAGSGPYTYTLVYTNTGNSTATAVKITDLVPAGLTHVANSGLWSVTGATTLTDAKVTYGTAPNQITYDYAVTTAGTVTAVVSNVAPGQSGTISFKVNVAAGTAPGVITNTAVLSYNDGSGATVNGVSNAIPFNVTPTANVTITGPTPVPSANPGGTAAFPNVVQNTGNGIDIFNMSLSAGNFPAGTSFVLYKSDGLTPLIDTNSDGIPDTGPLAAGASYTVVVKAVLPANAAGAGPFTVNKTATSTVDPTKFATTADTLTAITSATVNVTNNAPLGGPGVLGTGTGPEATAQVTNTTNPGTTTTFVVVANNTGPIADTYNLSASTVSTFASVPAGWTVIFKADGGAGNCSTTGATITNTSTVNAGSSATVCAVVSVPAGFAAGTSDLYFRAQSPATGAQDTIHDAVTVSAARALTFTPNNTGQVFPAGSTVYSHILTNNGNVLEGNGAVSTITFPASNSQAGWTSVQYFDANGNGVLDNTDPVIPAAGLQAVLPAGLTPGQSVTIFDKVIAPSGVAAGVVNTTTITATTANGTYTTTAPAAAPVTDTTTVIAGNVTLVKTQGLDPSCSGTPSAGFSTGTITTGAVPGACIIYQITVQNVGAANATAVTVSDSTPAYTVLSTAPATTVGSITTTPAVNASGSITATVGTLTPGQSAVVTFGVKIQQ